MVQESEIEQNMWVIELSEWSATLTRKFLFIFAVPGYKYPPVEANFSRTPLPPNEKVGSGDMNPNELRYVSCWTNL